VRSSLLGGEGEIFISRGMNMRDISWCERGMLEILLSGGQFSAWSRGEHLRGMDYTARGSGVCIIDNAVLS
jgi:hypothetical protein